MTENNFNLAGTLVAIAFAILTTATHAETLTGRVVGIADGDTLTLLDATLMPWREEHRKAVCGKTAQLPSDTAPQGLEVLVLKGELTGTDTSYPVGTWLRCALSQALAHRAQAGTEIYVKSRHVGEFA